MRNALVVLLVSATWACSASNGGGAAVGSDTEALAQCSAGQTALYSKVTPPSAGEDGASGIGSAPSVLSGNGSGGSSTGGGEGTSVPVDGPGADPTPGGTASSPSSPSPGSFGATFTRHA